MFSAWNSSYPSPSGCLSIVRKNCNSSNDTTRYARLPPTTQDMGAKLTYIHLNPNHWQFCVCLIMLSTFVVSFFTGNINPAWVINLTPCRNWYADRSIVVAILASWTVNNLLSYFVEAARNISHIFPVMRVRRDSTVDAKNVCAVIALRNDWIAYSQPSVSLTCRAQSSLVSAWYCRQVLEHELPLLLLLNSFHKRLMW